MSAKRANSQKVDILDEVEGNSNLTKSQFRS